MTPDEAAATNPTRVLLLLHGTPGKPRFGLDLDEDPTSPPPLLASWGRSELEASAARRGCDAHQGARDGQCALARRAWAPAWGLTSAHMASVLCQNPVWLARHATDMMPVG